MGLNILGVIDFDQRHKLVGGSSQKPCDLRDAERIFQYSMYGGVSDSFGPAANLIAYGFDIGDGGTTPTYFKASGQNSFVPGFDEVDAIRLDANSLVVNINIGASDTCDLSGMSLLSNASIPQNLTFDANTSTSGNYVTSVTTDYFDWTCKTGINIDGALVSNAAEIDAKGTQWNNCTISATRAGATEAAIAFDAKLLYGWHNY